MSLKLQTESFKKSNEKASSQRDLKLRDSFNTRNKVIIMIYVKDVLNIVVFIFSDLTM